jgi:glucose/arabinose dehydrogenase
MAFFIAGAEAEERCTPLETRATEANGQQPAFPGQTRTCGVKSNVAFEVTVLAKGLDHPWSVEPLPEGGFLVSERPGRLRRVSAKGDLGAPIEGLPPIFAKGQGGLLDIALAPDYAKTRRIYFSFSEPREGGGNATSVATAVLPADARRLQDMKVIFRALPAYNGQLHYGGRLAFGPDGMLYLTTGERSDRQMRPLAQRLDNHMGKTMRLKPDGTAPADNPFVGKADAKPEIWSYGHRNIQASAFDAQGRFWIVEHGTRGGDELNLIRKGGNYGWPVQAYGIEYAGSPIEGAATSRPDMQQPVYYWDPVIAPSGAQFYDGKAFPAWKGSLFIGALREHRLVRLVIEGERVVGEEHLLADRGKRIRDVREGPDGALYLVTDESDGELWRLAPK